MTNSTASLPDSLTPTLTLGFPDLQEVRDQEVQNLSADARVSGVTRAFVIYALLLIIVNVFLNGLVLFSVLYLQRRRLRSSHMLVLQLSISELLIALLYLPFLLVLLLHGSEVSDCRLLCAALAILERGLIAASTWGIALASLDRYLYIVKHATYRSVMTMRRSVGGMAAVWMIAAAFGVTSYLVSAFYRDERGVCVCHLTLEFYGFYHLLYSAGYITLCFILPTTLMLVFYGFVVRVARRRDSDRNKNPFRLSSAASAMSFLNHRMDLSSPTHTGPGVRGEDSRYVYKVKTARMLLLVMILYIACLTPYFAINIALATGHWNTHGFPYIFYLGSVLLVHSNSSCNPLLYGCAHRRLRMSLVDFLRSMVGRLVAKVTGGCRAWRRSVSKMSIMDDEESSEAGGSIHPGRGSQLGGDMGPFSTNPRETPPTGGGRDALHVCPHGPQRAGERHGAVLQRWSCTAHVQMVPHEGLPMLGSHESGPLDPQAASPNSAFLAGNPDPDPSSSCM